MKLLQINKFYPPIIGGVEIVVQQIAESLKEQQYVSDVLTCQKKGKRIVECIRGVTIYRASTFLTCLGMPLSFDFVYLFLNIRGKYDTFLLHHPFPLSFLLIPFIKNKDLFIWYHSDIVRQRFSKWIFMPFIEYGLRKSKKIFVSNQNIITSSSLLKKYADKCEIIYFGVDLDYFSENKQVSDSATDIKKKYGSPIVLSVGRLVYYKGYEFLIKAMSNIKNAQGEGQLIIVGRGPLEKKLRNLIQKLNLEQSVFIINSVSDVRPYYFACDVFVQPSIANSEAFGLVQLEAMAYGKPVINTNLPTGVREVSVDKVTGITVEPKDEKALSNAIHTILFSVELKKRFGQNAHKRVKRLFDKKNFDKALIKHLL